MEDQTMGVESAPVQAAEESVANSTSEGNVQNVSENAGIQPQTDQNLNFEKAFAARLSKERSKLEQSYSPYRYIVERAAADNNMSVDEYVKAIKEQYEQKEFEGIDPKVAEDIKYVRSMRQQEMEKQNEASEKQKWDSEVRGFYETFKDVQGKDIPDEVFEARVRDGVPLKYAYAMYKLGKERTEIEQQVLKNINQNKMSTPGSLSGMATDGKVSPMKMNKKDFNALKEAVLRGEVTGL